MPLETDATGALASFEPLLWSESAEAICAAAAAALTLPFVLPVDEAALGVSADVLAAPDRLLKAAMSGAGLFEALKLESSRREDSAAAMA